MFKAWLLQQEIRVLVILGLALPIAFQSTMAAPASPDSDGVQTQKDIVYLDGTNPLKLDMYRPATIELGKRYPAIVIIHGGGWAGGEKSNQRERNFGTTLARAGYICASIDYVLATKDRHTWPNVLYQCKNAVQFLRKNSARYQIDPKHIGAMGGSAGGHLSLMLGLTSVTNTLQPPGAYAGVSSRVQAVADFYGPTDLPNLGLDKYCEMLLGINKTQGHEKWEEASPINYVTAGAPPILIVHGTKDTAVPVSQPQELIARLKQKGVRYESTFVNGAEHSFDLNPPQQDLGPIVIDFFNRYLRLKR